MSLSFIYGRAFAKADMLYSCFYLTIVLPALVSAYYYNLAWQNSIGERDVSICGRGVLIGFKGFYIAGDRRWKWFCRNNKEQGGFRTCYWSDYINHLNGVLDARCDPNYVLSGVASVYTWQYVDRLFKIYCCSYENTGYSLIDCKLSGYINDLMKPLRYYLKHDRAIVGLYSTFSDVFGVK